MALWGPYHGNERETTTDFWHRCSQASYLSALDLCLLFFTYYVDMALWLTKVLHTGFTEGIQWHISGAIPWKRVREHARLILGTDVAKRRIFQP